MRFLVDQPVSPLLAQWLSSDEGGCHDAVHVRQRGLSAAEDAAIFALAQLEGRIVITADLDFARIMALSGSAGPGLILFRAGNSSDLQMLTLLRRVLAEVSEDALPSSVVVVEERSIRIASLPIRKLG
jgi:predicted nuclease of predicted toxin-antitoxin system